MRVSRSGIVASSLPGVIMLCLFYSLALHMYLRLGAWPTSIGERGFPAPLVAHANIDMCFFIANIWFIMVVLPMAILVALLRPKWRRSVPYLALYALVFCACWGLMQLAPAPFLYWWRD